MKIHRYLAQSFVILSFFVSGVVADIPAVTLPTSKIILKTVHVSFEPVEVLLLEEGIEHQLSSLVLDFRLLKAKVNSDSSPNNLVVALSPISAERKPIALLIKAAPSKLDCAEAISVLIEPADIVEASIVGPMREKVLELRSQFTTLKKDLVEREESIKELKSKAASITRLSRLVEAQSTVASLNRKLEGLKSDSANISLLLNIIGQQSNSARLDSNKSALSRDLRLLSEEGAGAKNHKGVSLSEAKRESVRKVIEKARGLNLEKLREQVQGYRYEQYQDESTATEGDSYFESPEL